MICRLTATEYHSQRKRGKQIGVKVAKKIPLDFNTEVNEYFDLALRGNNGRYAQYPQTGWIPWLDDPRILSITPFALDGHHDEWGHSNWLEMSRDDTILGVIISP